MGRDSGICIIAICSPLTLVAFFCARASNFHSNTKDYDFDLQHNKYVWSKLGLLGITVMQINISPYIYKYLLKKKKK